MDKIRLFPCALTAAGIKKKYRKDRWWHLSPPISSLFFFFFFFLSNTFLILLYPQQFFSSLFFLYVFISFCERSIPSQGLLLVCKSVERRLPPFVRTLRALPQLCLTEGDGGRSRVSPLSFYHRFVLDSPQPLPHSNVRRLFLIATSWYISPPLLQLR